MTLEELILITRFNIRRVLIIIFVGLTASIFLWLSSPREYSSTAIILSPNADILGITTIANEAKLKSAYPSDINVATSSNSKQVTITAKSNNPEFAITFVNSIADSTLENAKTIYTDKTIQAVNATSSTLTSKSLGYYLAIGVLLSGILAEFYTILTYLRKPLVLSAASLAERTGLPILATYPFADGGASALAAILLQRETLPHKIAFLPVQSSLQTQSVMGTLRHAFENHLGIGYQGKMPECKFVNCSSIFESVANLYVTHSADATIVFVNLFEDNYKQVDYVLGELKKSSSNIAGFVVCKGHSRDAATGAVVAEHASTGTKSRLKH